MKLAHCVVIEVKSETRRTCPPGTWGTATTSWAHRSGTRTRPRAWTHRTGAHGATASSRLEFIGFDGCESKVTDRNLGYLSKMTVFSQNLTS